MALQNKRLGAALSAVAGAALAVTPLTATHAEQARPEPVSYQTVAYSHDAMIDATRWSKQNSNGAAVAVYLGQRTNITPQEIEGVLRGDFERNGVGSVEFFYQRNDAPATGFTLHQNGHTYGVYRLGDVRQKVPMVADQVRLNLRPELARN